MSNCSFVFHGAQVLPLITEGKGHLSLLSFPHGAATTDHHQHLGPAAGQPSITPPVSLPFISMAASSRHNSRGGSGLLLLLLFFFGSGQQHRCPLPYTTIPSCETQHPWEHEKGGGREKGVIAISVVQGFFFQRRKSRHLHTHTPLFRRKVNYAQSLCRSRI